MGVRGGAVGWGTALQARRSRVRFSMVSLKIFIDIQSFHLCNKLITRLEESYQLWCVVVCDLETSIMRRPWPTLGRSATGEIQSFRPYCGAGVDSGFYRCGYQKYFLKGKGGRVLKSGIFNRLGPSGPVQACNGTVLPFICRYALSVRYCPLIILILPKSASRVSVSSWMFCMLTGVYV